MDSEPTLAPQRIRRFAPAKRRRLITEACVAVIAEQGFSSTTMREIAKRAGVSIGTVLHHFSSKDEILLACMERIMETWAQTADRILSTNEPPLRRLEK